MTPDDGCPLTASEAAPGIPSDGSLDATFALLRDGYTFIGRRCDRLGSDVFRTRLMGRSAVCCRGPRWTRLFYGSDGVTRVGAMPSPVLRLLQDKGSVQQLDGAAHRHRKPLFTELLLDEDRISELAHRFRQVWLARLPEWRSKDEIEVLREVSGILAEAACGWAGLALDAGDLDAVSGSLFRMVDQAGRPRLLTLLTLLERRRTEALLRQIVERYRREGGPPDAPLTRIVRHRNGNGDLLTPDEATVELLNILRPLVAVGRYITFAALTLHRRPEWRNRLREGEDELVEPFCEEVRRMAPFFPLTAAITTRSLEWQGLALPAGQWLLLDLYGTLRDPDCFPEPEVFRPERRLSWRDGEDCFIPHGGGDVHRTHRCPGEMATVALMAEATRILCRDMTYEVPDQDLDVRLNRIPAQPESGFVLVNAMRTPIAESNSRASSK